LQSTVRDSQTQNNQQKVYKKLLHKSKPNVPSYPLEYHNYSAMLQWTGGSRKSGNKLKPFTDPKCSPDENPAIV